MRARTRATCRTPRCSAANKEKQIRGDPGEVSEIGTDQVGAGLIELRRL
jgi:hypothetical protein